MHAPVLRRMAPMHAHSCMPLLTPLNRYAMIYAGAQKNVGPSGVVIAIIREDLLGHAR